MDFRETTSYWDQKRHNGLWILWNRKNWRIHASLVTWLTFRPFKSRPGKAQGRLVRPPLPPYMEPDADFQSRRPTGNKIYKSLISQFLRPSPCSPRSSGVLQMKNTTHHRFSREDIGHDAFYEAKQQTQSCHASFREHLKGCSDPGASCNPSFGGCNDNWLIEEMKWRGLEYGWVRNEHPFACQTATTRRRLSWLINWLYDMQLLVVPMDRMYDPWSSRIGGRDSSPLLSIQDSL